MRWGSEENKLGKPRPPEDGCQVFSCELKRLGKPRPPEDGCQVFSFGGRSLLSRLSVLFLRLPERLVENDADGHGEVQGADMLNLHGDGQGV